MSDGDPADGHGVDAGERPEPRAASPTVLVAATADTAKRLSSWLEDDLAVEAARSATAAKRRADRSVCVALLGAAVSAESKEELLETVDLRCPFARTIVVPEDDQPPMLDAPGYDLCLYRPLEEEAVVDAVTTLARVATYERTLSTYFHYTQLAANREVGRSAEELREDDVYRTIESTIDRLRDRLERMQESLTPAELDVLFESLEDEEAAGFTGEVREAPYTGQPENCAECGLDWRVDHGGELGVGYDRLGAFVWKCRRCGTIQQRSDPSHQWIA